MVRILVFLFLVLPFTVSAQIWDFSVPEKLPANINTEYEEAFPLLSPDGKTLYFSRMLYPQNQGGKFSGSDIWVSSQQNDRKIWSKASSVTTLNDRGNNAVVGIHASGQTLYILKTTGAEKPDGIYFSKKTGNTWSKAEVIPIEGLDPKGFLGFYVSPDFEVIFISMRAADSRGEEDLYVSFKNSSGQWSKPRNLGSSVNTSGFEISPFLSPDKKRLYFSSNGHKGFGDADIFYSDRLYNSWDTWSAPRNLGENLNSKNFDAYFSIYGDSIAYFSSNRNANKYADIYKVKVVPGNEVLAFGQRYLTTEELSRVLGANVPRKITFEKNAVDLNAAQKELIYFMSSKLEKDKDINLHISVLEENNPTLTQQRMDAIANHLRSSGVENVRLLMTNNARVKKKNTANTVIEILLFK